MFMYRKYAVIGLSSVLFVGCAGPKTINSSDLNGIEKVYLITESAQVKLDYQGPSVSWGMAIGGAIGGLISSTSTVKETDAIEAFLAQEDVQLVDYVRAKMLEDLQDGSARLKLVDNYEDSDARLFLDSITLTYHTSNPLTSSVEPLIAVEGSLVPNGGTAIWEGKNKTTLYAVDTEKGRSLPEWFVEPEVARRVLLQTADIAVDGLMEDYAKAVGN